MKLRLLILLAAFSVFLLASCRKDDVPTALNNGLIGKWRLYERYSDPGDGSGKWYAVKAKNAEVIEFRADSTLRVIALSPSSGWFGNQGPQRFTVRGKEFYLYDTQPQIEPFSGIRFEVTPERLTLNFPCDEGCGGRYVAVE
ncbi:MAG: hypothetical protein H7Y12_02095 [Sphingobacteriaceae bacterium]|nr:hypothetical protein [Cytophagaceae bacterium]